MATVIRATDGKLGTGSVAFNFDDMAAEAKNYLDHVRAEAVKIVAKAQQEAAEVRRGAEIEGRQAAEQAVEQVVAKHLATVLPALRQAVNDIHDAKQAWLAHWEASGVHVAAAIAKRLIRGELTRQPEIPVTLVREALELAAGSCADPHPPPSRRPPGPGGTGADVGAGDVRAGGRRDDCRRRGIAGRLPRRDPLRRHRPAVRGPVGPHRRGVDRAPRQRRMKSTMPDFTAQLDALMPTALTGTVAQTVGMTIAAAGFPAPVGAVAEIQREAGAALLAEVIGFRDELTLLVSL